ANVVKFNGSTWAYVGTPNFSAGRAEDIDLTLDASGTPYVAFRDYSNSTQATVMKYNGTSWITVGSEGFSEYFPYNFTMALDPFGTPYVAYENTGFYETHVMVFNGY